MEKESVMSVSNEEGMEKEKEEKSVGVSLKEKEMEGVEAMGKEREDVMNWVSARRI